MSRWCCCFPGGGGGSADSKMGNKVSSASSTTHAAASASASDTVTQKAGNHQLSPILVELFTSQGCKSCPSADLLVSKLASQTRSGSALISSTASDMDNNDQMNVTLDVPLIVLSYHVDYWDYLGWKDPFANSLWSSRQRAYGEALQQDSIYTPEAVIQGRSHCIASNTSTLTSLISNAPRFPALDVRATFSRPSPSDLEVSVAVSIKTKVEGNVDIWLAVFENGLVTDCTKGENMGRVLTNDFVVRSLQKVCTVQNVTKKPVKGQASIKLWESYSKAKSGMALFIQSSLTMEVHGAQLIELPDDA